MTPTQQQFEVLRGIAAQASIQGLPDGSHLIVVPAYELPDGWSKARVDIKLEWQAANEKLKEGRSKAKSEHRPVLLLPNYGVPD